MINNGGYQEIINVNDRIQYLPASDNPLSADVGIIRGDSKTWFFDVGNCDGAFEIIRNEERETGIVISHFHPDHMGNLSGLLGVSGNEVPQNHSDTGKITPPKATVYVGEHTYKYTKTGEIIQKELFIEDGCRLHIFPIPSSHAKGSLGLEVDEEFAFLGDATYATNKNGRISYNVQLLREEIKVLSALKAKAFLLSHKTPMLQPRDEVLEGLNRIYDMRKKGEAYIQ